MDLKTMSGPNRASCLPPPIRTLNAYLRDEPDDTMIDALSEFVSFPSVSNHIGHAEDCRQAAKWLRKRLTQFGAEAQLVSGLIIKREKCSLMKTLLAVAVWCRRKEPDRPRQVPRDRERDAETTYPVLRVSCSLCASRHSATYTSSN